MSKRGRGAASAVRAKGAKQALLLGALILLGAACVPAPPSPPSGPQPPTIIVYGDSIVTSSSTVLKQDLAAAKPDDRVIVEAGPGAAVCDFFGVMNGADAQRNAQLVILDFAGASVSSCMQTPDYEQKWFLDLAQATDIWRRRGAKVLLVADPGYTGTTPSDTSGSIVPRWIAQVDAELAYLDADPLVRSLDTGPGWINPATGRYAKYRPCLPDEQTDPVTYPGCDATTGMIQVRKDDGLHFCLATGQPPGVPCPTYSSGIRRYAQVIADAAQAWS